MNSSEQIFSSKLLDERCERYPAIYTAISDLAKRLKAAQERREQAERALDEGSLAQIMKTIDALDCEHGLFYSIRTSFHMAALRDRLYKAHDSLREKGSSLSAPELDEIRSAASRAEIALKKDIGILIDEFQAVRAGHAESDYQEILEKER